MLARRSRRYNFPPRPMRDWWTAEKLAAAELCSHSLNMPEAVRRSGIPNGRLRRWLRQPEFREKIAEHLEHYRMEALIASASTR
jgi:hypothetical protein